MLLFNIHSTKIIALALRSLDESNHLDMAILMLGFNMAGPKNVPSLRSLR